MSASNSLETALLGLIFNGTAIAGLADNAASSPLTNLYVSLYTADPGEGGSQTTSEATYTGYARVAVARSALGWLVAGNAVNPVAAITFPSPGGASPSNTITHWGIGSDPSGAGTLYFSGPASPSVTVVAGGPPPELTTGSQITAD